jgi:HSP20 family protein
MGTNNQSQDTGQGGQQGHMPQQGQQTARGGAEVQQAGQGAGAQQGSVAQRSPDPGVGVLRPPVDVIEDATGITLLADLPGVSKDNLNLRLEAQSLTIEAAMTLDLPADMEPRHAEVRHQHYERTFALSRELNGEQATAELTHGVLRIRIPKSQDAVPRKIPVSAGA